MKMRTTESLVVCLLFFLASVGQIQSQKAIDEWPIGSARACLKEKLYLNLLGTTRVLEVLPGSGWDNLKNVNLGLIVSQNYTKCIMTQNENLLLPNYYNAQFRQTEEAGITRSILHTNWIYPGEVEWNNINVRHLMDIPQASISGSYSSDLELVRWLRLEHDYFSIMSRRNFKQYNAWITGVYDFTPAFRTRILLLMLHIQYERPVLAIYDAQLIVRDFGTHLLTEVEGGGTVTRVDYINRDNLPSVSKQDLAAYEFMATVSFDKHYNLPVNPKAYNPASLANNQGSLLTLKFYEEKVEQSITTITGGTPMDPQATNVHAWIEGLKTNMAAINRVGIPLYKLIEPKYFVGLPEKYLVKTRYLIKQAVELYYEMNVVPGCATIGTINFTAISNVDDGTCNKSLTNFRIGGVFQICSVFGEYLDNNPCAALVFKNPLTDNFTCPDFYEQVMLRSGRYEQVERRTSCISCGFMWLSKCCDTTVVSYAVYNTYWCASTKYASPTSGLYFGGVYTVNSYNRVTLTTDCPSGSAAFMILDGLFVCLSETYIDMGVPFGGFFSCSSGNPLAGEGNPKQCPEGYNQIMATDDLGCGVYYCTQLVKAPFPQPIKELPFMHQIPDYTAAGIDMYEFDVAKRKWTPIKRVEDTSDNFSPGGALGVCIVVGVSCTLLCVALLLTVLTVRSRKRRASGTKAQPISKTSDVDKEGEGTPGEASGGEQPPTPRNTAVE